MSLSLTIQCCNIRQARQETKNNTKGLHLGKHVPCDPHCLIISSSSTSSSSSLDNHDVVMIDVLVLISQYSRTFAAKLNEKRQLIFGYEGQYERTVPPDLSPPSRDVTMYSKTPLEQLS